MTVSSGRSAALNAGVNLVLAAVNAATGVLAARLLGPTGRGELAAVQLWGIAFSVFATLGVAEAVVYFVARNRERAGVITVTAACIISVSALVFLAVGYVALPVLLRAQSPEVVHLARVFLLIVPVYGLVGLPGQVLRGASEFGRWNVVRITPTLIWLGVLLSALATGNRNVEYLTYGLLSVTALSSVVVVVMARPVLRAPFVPDPALVGPLLRFGLPTMLTGVPQLLNLRLDQMLLAAFVSPPLLGLYVAAVAWSGVITPVVSGIGSVVFPKLAAESSGAERERVLFSALRMSVLVSAGALAVALAATPLAMRTLFGPEFTDGIGAALLLVVAGAILPFNLVLQEAFRGLGAPAEVLRGEVAGLLATGVLLALLLRPLALEGAALASIGGYLTVTMVLLRRLRSHVRAVRLADLRPRRADVQALSATIRQVTARRPASA